MAEIIAHLQKLQSLPKTTHWFCPRESAEENDTFFFDEDIDHTSESSEERATRKARIKQAHDRKALFFEAAQILAFDGADALPYQESLAKCLSEQLIGCNVCVREYHRARSQLQNDLHSQHDAELVSAFMTRYDQLNIKRIAQGLDSAKLDMQDLEPAQRRLSELSQPGLFALFETMHCVPALYDAKFLTDHFDEPFRLIQTKQKIYLPDCTPALAAFLFSDHPYRKQWALRGWQKFKRDITGAEFDWSVKDQLMHAVSRVPITALQKDFMPTFWQGVSTILTKLDREVITHHLRAMDADLCKLALDHMQVESPSFQDMLGSLRLLLEKAPTDFWDALGAISPATVVEQIFSSPNFSRIMRDTTGDSKTNLEQICSWIPPFIRSIRPGSQGSACRGLLHQAMVHVQKVPCSDFVRRFLQIAGLNALAEAFTAASDSDTVSGTALSDLLNVLHHYLPNIMPNIANRLSSSEDELRRISLAVLASAVSADLQLLMSDRKAIMSERNIAPDSSAASAALWSAVMKNTKSDDIEFVAAVARAIQPAITLVAIPPKEIAKAPRESAAWDTRCHERFAHINEMLERVQDFEGEAIGLFLEDGGESLVTLLFSGNKVIQQSAAAAVRALTSESSRRDAVRFMLANYYRQTLLALSEALTIIVEARVFLSSTMVIKVGMDFIQALCDSQDGVLRSRTLDDEEMEITEAAWESFWDAIKMLFDATEPWSHEGHDKHVMMEFCRDAMDFVGQAFDIYSVISSSLHTGASSSEAQLDVDQRLLASPTRASTAVVLWLRLRDDYLITKIISLICKLLGRFQEVDLEPPEEVLKYVEDVLGDRTRNKISAAQKAELRQGLNLKIEAIPVAQSRSSTQAAQKQGSLRDWYTGESSTGSSFSTASSAQGRRQGSIDLAGWRAKADQSNKKNLDKMITSVSPTLDRLKISGLPFGQKSARLAPQTSDKSSPYVNDFLRRRHAAMELQEKKKREAAQALRGLGNAGSGLKGVGVEGKDHSSKGQGVMVSSDESESDDEGGLDEELFGPSIKSSTKRKSTVKSDAAGAIGLKPEVKPTKIQRVVRTKKDMRARLAPNLAPLYKIILSWNYFHKGEYPPGGDEWAYKKVANSFRHIQDYRDTFQPLLSLEAWQGMVKAREEETFKPYEIKIANRVSVDSFIELSTTLSQGDFRDLQISEGDIILLSTSNKPSAKEDAPHCLARVNSIKRKAKSVEVLYRVMPGTPITSSLTPETLIYGAKVQSIVPLEREFGVLTSLEYYDLCDEIIKAKPSPLLDYNDKQLAPYMSNYSVNKAQAKAIRSAVDNDAFTLIQGPPGSGKTKTITAIVGALLSDSLGGSNDTVRLTTPSVNGASESAIAPKKLLVCAPSNAAVDELVMRLKEGIKTTRGLHKKINVVRVGRSEAVNSAVVDVTLEELINRKLGSTNGNDGTAREQTQKLMMEHKKVSDTLRESRDRIETPDLKAEERSKLQDEINQLRKRKTELGNQIDHAKDAENAAGRTADLHRKRVQQSIIEDSHVICATLSGSGHQLFQDLNVEFETVVIDEAAQCVEMSALIPLKYGCAKCILVGDPKQLPPTVFSKEAARFQYEQSLFVRMQTNYPDAVHLLDTQYRMHPDISAFPSATFYDGRLLDGPDMAGLRQRPWHTSSMLAPYRFFDVEGQHESAPKGHSLVNRAEISVALALYQRLLEDFRDYDFNNKIGIITPYKSQLRLLKETFSSRYGDAIMDRLEFNTTDAFQGRESEIIIFSCVRASPAGNIGFLQDIRRMNVGLTRAKCSLWVLGNSQSLMRGQYWKKLVEDAQARELWTGGKVLSILKQPSSNFPAKARVAKAIEKPAPAKDTKEAAAPVSNGNPVVKPVAKRIVSSNPSDLAMFRTVGSAPAVASLKAKTEPKAEPKTEVTPEVKQEEKSEPKTEPESKVNGALKKEPVKLEAKTEPKPTFKGEVASDGSRAGTPLSSGPTTPAAGPPKKVIKRKAPTASVFMPSKKKR